MSYKSAKYDYGKGKGGCCSPSKGGRTKSKKASKFKSAKYGYGGKGMGKGAVLPAKQAKAKKGELQRSQCKC